MNFPTRKAHLLAFLAVALLLLAVAVAAPQLPAQTLTQGSISGTVTDPSGAVVPKASITAKNEQTGATATATTNGTGFYRVSLLPPGTYTVTATAPNFQPTSSTVGVSVGQTSTANLQLALAAAKQTVVVEAGGAVVQKENPNVATTMSQQQVQGVPNGGGDLSYIAQTAPGATMNTQAGYGNFSTFGLPGLANNFTINSAPENDPFLDLNNSGATNILLGRNDVQEATVVNNGYSGEYSAAGADVNYVSKSGTNNFHGLASWYWNGRTMNANNFFNKQNSPATPRGFVNDNQWAASFGGPIQKDKTFFFVNTEGLYVLVPVSRSVNIPSPAFSSAVLSNIAVTQPSELPLYTSMMNLYSNAPNAASAVNTLANGGCADFTGAGFGAANPCALQLHSTVTGSTHEWQITGRLDHNFSDSDKAFVHFKMDRGLQATYTDPLNPIFNITSFQPDYEGQLQWVHTLSANTVNSFSLNGSYYRAIFVQPNLKGALALQPVEVSFAGHALYDVGHDFSFPFGFPQGRNVTQYGFVDDASHTMGNHTLKFGANLARYDITDYDPGIGSIPAVTNETMTDLFNGTASTFQQSFPARTTQPVSLYNLGFYLTDQWRVRNNLSLTLTFRADRYSNPACNTNCFNRLVAPFADVAASSTLATPYNQSILTGQRLALPSSYHPWGLSPRIGFNWSPLGTSHNTVVSGGFGLFSASQPAGFVDNLMNNLPGDPTFILSGLPFGPTSSGNAQSAALAAAQALSSGFAGGATFASLAAAVPSFSVPNFYNVGNDFHVPRIQEWDLQLQQGIGTKTSISIKYVGNHGIWEQIPNNGLNAYCDATCLSALGFSSFTGLPSSPADPRFLQMTEVTTGYTSNYNGVTITGTRRFSSLQFQVNYTYSHALDFLSNGGIAAEPFNFNTNASITNPQNPFDVRQNMYGNADYDVRHYLSFNYVYTTPNKMFHSILGGWTIGGTMFWRSGLPFTVIDSGTGGVLNAFGYGTVNPNFGTFADQTGGAGSILCGGQIAKSGAACSGMTANFAPDSGGFGNQRRNQVYGPHFFDTDLTLAKNFHIPHWEKGQLSFGITAFNLFNHPNFDQPVGDVASSSFGTIVSNVNPPTSIYGSFLGADASPRLLQTQLKLVF